MHHFIREKLRLLVDGDKKATGAIIDSQSIKTMGKRGSTGYDGAKKIK